MWSPGSLSDWHGPGSAWRRWRLSRNSEFAAIPGYFGTRHPLRRRSDTALSRVADVGEIRDFFDEDLRQLIDPVAHQTIAGARGRRGAASDVIDRRAHDRPAFCREHS